MSLTSALNIAQTALFNTSRQTSVVSRNVSEASNPDYAHRSALLSSMAPGARVVQIRRAADEVLFRQNLFAISAWQGQKAMSGGLDTMRLTVNGVEDANAQVDMNVVATADGQLIEVQGTGEERAFARSELDQLLDLALSGIAKLGKLQEEAITAGLAEAAR